MGDRRKGRGAGARLDRCGPLDPHPQIVPRGLPGDRVGIRVGVAAIVGQQFRDQMVEQKSLAELGRVGVEVPGPGALADRVPGPHRVRVDPVHQLRRDADPPVMARDPHPIFLVEAERPAGHPVDVQPVVAEDLAQPRVLRMPRMVHLHRPLGQRVQREGRAVDPRFLERHVPERQRVEIGRDAVAVARAAARPRRVLGRQGESAATARHRAAARSVAPSSISPIVTAVSR